MSFPSFPISVLTNHSRQAITYRGTQIHNDIQCNCKSSGSIDLFKLTLKRYLLSLTD